MHSKERIHIVLNHGEPDRIPVDLWATGTVYERLIKHYGARDRRHLLDLLDIDLRYIPGPLYKGPRLKTLADGSQRDIWGVWRKDGGTVGGESYRHVTRYPLERAETVGEIRDYPHWPSADWFDYSILAGQCRAAGERATVFSGGRLNRTSQLKAAIYLRGMDRVMEDMHFAPRILEAILGRIRDFYLEFNRRVYENLENELDIFMMGDDFGMQENLLCSRRMWRRFFRPGLKQFINLAHQYGIPVMHHSCGAIRPLIPDLIDLNLDILNPVQPEAAGMSPRELKQEFGKLIIFHGGISIQNTLPRGTKEEVDREVREVFEALGAGGGYIACTAHNLQSDVPLRNIEALFAAYGTYR